MYPKDSFKAAFALTFFEVIFNSLTKILNLEHELNNKSLEEKIKWPKISKL